MDHFKEINDQFGHSAGDEALVEIARLLLQHSRGFAVITRFGGDEFAVVLANTLKAGTIEYSQRIRRVIAEHAFKHGPLTVSLGVACLPEDVARGENLIPAADKALYAAKRRGRNRVGAL